MVFCRVQVVANIAAVLSSLSRFFATIMLGMCHVGMIQPDQLADTFQYGKLRLNGADNACDSQIGYMYNLVYEVVSEIWIHTLT
jgi:hypothetical protein